MKKQSIGRVVRAGMVLAGLAFTGLVYAQPGTGMTGGPGMAQGMSADRQEQMQSLQQMSDMMSTMSGMMAQGMMGAGTQSKMQEMRHGMDGMMQSAPAGGK